MDKILLVSGAEDKLNLQLTLKRMGYELSRPGEQADAIIASSSETDGVRLSNLLRLNETKRKVPLLLTVNRETTIDSSHLTSVFEMADDFILTPVHSFELSIRMKALLKKSKEIDDEPAEISCGDLKANRSSLSVYVNCTQRTLTVLEFRLLWFLMKNEGKVVSRQMILQNVWKGTVVSNRTIDAHIVGLRRALHGMNYRIETIYGAGYALRQPLTIEEKISA